MKKLNKVLLVDDSNATIFYNRTILTKTGYIDEVLVANNGLEALEMIKSGVVPDLLFLDINMPVMNGWDFLAEFKKLDSSCKNTKIILMLGSLPSEEDMMIPESIDEVKESRGKMLSKAIMDEIISTYFDPKLAMVS